MKNEKLKAMFINLCLTFNLIMAASPVYSQQTIQLWLTVDWEGLSLVEDNLQAIRLLRQKFPTSRCYIWWIRSILCKKMPAVRRWRTPTLTDAPMPCEGDSCGYSVSFKLAYMQKELVQLVSCSSDYWSATAIIALAIFVQADCNWAPKCKPHCRPIALCGTVPALSPTCWPLVIMRKARWYNAFNSCIPTVR